MEEVSRSKRVAKNTGIMFVRMLFLVVIGLFTSREVLRILGVEDFGIYNLVGTIVVMFTFLQNALSNATTRFFTYDLGSGDMLKLRNTFSMCVNSEILLAIVILVLTEIVGPWFIDSKLHIPQDRLFAAHVVFQLSLINFVLGILRTPYNSAIVAHERFDYFAYTSIVEAILKLLFVYLLTVSSFDKLITYGCLLCGVTVIIFVWMFIYCNVHFEETRYKWHWDSTLLTNLTKYSGLSLLVNVVDVVVIQSFGIFFNLFSGVVANAALGVANQVNSKLNGFLANFSQSYKPQIIKSYASKDYVYFLKLLHSAGKLAFFLYFAMAFPIMLNIEFILDIWLDTVPPDTGIFVCLIIGYMIFDSFSEPLWCAVHATGNLKVHQLLMASIKALNIPISYIFLKLGFPVYIVLVVYVAMNICCTVTRIWWMSHLIHLDIKQYYKEVVGNILKITTLSIPIPIFIHFFVNMNNFLGLILESFLFFFIYLITIYRFALNEKELEIVRSVLGKFLPYFRR